MSYFDGNTFNLACLYLAYRIAYRMWLTQEGLARPLESFVKR